MMKIILSLSLVLLSGCSCSRTGSDFKPDKVVPSVKQIEYQSMEYIGFIHYNLFTFPATIKDPEKAKWWGSEPPSTFNPKGVDTEQWVKVAKEAGMKELILTVKHHDGFCIWPSAFSDYTVRESPYKSGKGDIVKEFTDACHKFGIKAGLYYSPWDAHHADYGKPEYITFFKNQLRELLTNYGEISEMWFDGAAFWNGYYGGARERRVVNRDTYYPWKEINDLIYELQPGASIFNFFGPDLRWIGNEEGVAGETCWSTITADSLKIETGKSIFPYLAKGDPDGRNWIIGQCDVPDRPSWSWRKDDDDKVKTPQQLVDLYYKSIGRNTILLLNVPPNTDGVFPEQDVAALMEFKLIIEETFRENLAENAKATATNFRGNAARFNPGNITDTVDSTYWAADDNQKTASIEIEINGAKPFDRILLQEPIRYGQRISEFNIEVFRDNLWQPIAKGTTIGYKRIFRIEPVQCSMIRINITRSVNTPALSNFALYKSSLKEM
jgi:alpha-L-fucosidase